MSALSSQVALGLIVAAAASAQTPRPMDLANPAARWVAVRALVAPSDAADGRLSPPARAWYEPGATPGERVVSVPGPEVEQHLRRRAVVGRALGDDGEDVDGERLGELRAEWRGEVRHLVERGGPTLEDPLGDLLRTEGRLTPRGKFRLEFLERQVQQVTLAHLIQRTGFTPQAAPSSG